MIAESANVGSGSGGDPGGGGVKSWNEPSAAVGWNSAVGNRFATGPTVRGSVTWKATSFVAPVRGSSATRIVASRRVMIVPPMLDGLGTVILNTAPCPPDTT